MKKLWAWIKSLFTRDGIGVIWRTIFTAAKSSLAQMVSDPENQQKALDLVRDLASTKLTNEEKRGEFETLLKAWAKAAGKDLSDAVVNALRENAVIALKCEGCCDPE